jgi:ABC-type transport system involved in multi-copper enzyme maturation permease subunit
MAAWRSYFEDPFPKESIIQSIVILAVHNIVLISVSLFQFNRKDITA